MARPKRSEQIDLQEAIKTTAWRQIAETGAAALSLRGIARELGITAPAIYNYFPSRDELVTALIVEAFTSFADALEEARDALPADDHAGRFRAISLAYRRWATTYPQRYALIFGTPIPGYHIGEAGGPASERSFLVLVGVIGEAHWAGQIHLAPDYASLSPQLEAQYQSLNAMGLPYPPIVIHLALAFWSRIHGLTSLELYGYIPGFLADKVDEFMDHEIDMGMRILGLK